MRTQVQGTKVIDRDFAVESKAIEANGSYFFTTFIKDTNLDESRAVSGLSLKFGTSDITWATCLKATR